ncbi:MAG: rhodanese-like domain-containing protein [Myxococcales bacterium]|nr:rhodanese-like domain-containing protein [Myxococcales bacterium]
MKRRSILLLIVAVALAGTACSRSKESADLKKLSVDEVATRIAANDGKTFIFDNNPKGRYEKGHLPGAKWVDFKAVTASDLPADKSATLVFYCASEL